MSPTESRNGTNTNRVRFFGPNQLQKSSAQNKWDRVKIVCTQPYNKVRAQSFKIICKIFKHMYYGMFCEIAVELQNTGEHFL